ncbi:breast carcinoma-amplified sequence 1 isoform X1 [Centrocercus urophasianus]|uniref:breast carcinoma-amplified sequence 1 isoform X1 n=1 Tax=Centrocercus urophasianus TaxID=9002 RepID=UPI001C64D484|nr:breast carcinoma-amplified sequence 1 isoform X1 [Centrocercus urophasianus]XP_042690380.1 breast carcinoma-amplified sequence 1 isoform X1 [Centrocercus urophasianus]
MGNTGSAPEEVKGDCPCPVISYQALPESPATVKNGSAVFAQDHSPAMNGGVAVKESVARDNAAASSPKTKEQSAAVVGREAAGSAARRALPSAKHRSVFAFSWSVPGRTEDPASDSSVGLAKLDVSSEAHGVNKAPSDSTASPAAAAPQPSTHKEPEQALPAAAPRLSSPAVPGTPEGEDAAVLKPKQVNFFDKIFKLEKGKEKSQAQPGAQEGGQPLGAPDGRSTTQEAAGPQSASNSIPTEKEIDDCNQRDLQQDSAGVSGLPAGQPEKAEVKQDNSQAATAVDNNSVMSFLKTLVSPSKAEARSEPEDKGSKAEQGRGGQPAPKTAESPTKGAKKKKAESPKLGHSTFSKLFRHKAVKETQQTTNTKISEQQPVTSVKSDKNVPSAQEPQTAKQSTKAPEPTAQQQAAATEAPREAAKEKGSSTPMPLSKLFWKKNASEEAEFAHSEKADTSLEAVTPDKDERSPEVLEVKPRREESKTPKANLRKFFKLSGRGSGGPTPPAEEIAPSPEHQTLNSTERPVATAESEPVGQKSKESSKDKKPPAELSKQKGSKQETREQPDCREQHAAETDSIQSGGDAAKDPTSFKRMEKRQSFGGFFKGLGSKRMSDAEVQTDPVSILPAGKSK